MWGDSSAARKRRAQREAYVSPYRSATPPRRDGAAAAAQPAQTPAPAPAPAKAASVFDKLTDTSSYTGHHKQRFGKDGRGRGLDGRDSADKSGGDGQWARQLGKRGATGLSPGQPASAPAPSTPRSAAKMRTVASEELQALKRKLQSLSYGIKGQDPRKLFGHYDRDNSGLLDFAEFQSAVRKGGHMTPAMLSDADLRKLFGAVDSDGSGDVSIEELTAFVWGNGNRLKSTGSAFSSVSETAAPPPSALQAPAEGPLALPTKAERDAAFDLVDFNGNGTLSLAEIDKAVVEIWPQFNHKQALMRAYKAADVSGDGWIGVRPCVSNTRSWLARRNVVSYCLDTRAGCFLALGCGLRLVGTVPSRRGKRAKNGDKRGGNGRVMA